MELRAYLNTLDCSNRPHKNEEVWIKHPKGYFITTMKSLKSVANGEYNENSSDIIKLLDSELETYDFDFSRLCVEDLIKIKVKLK
jgi:hypothetical protein